MKRFRIVVDSSCLITLSNIKQFGLLKELFSEIVIPQAVFDEVVTNGKGKAGSEETQKALDDGWLLKRSVKDEIALNALRTVLGSGESEVIVLYQQMHFDYALIDEKTARSFAELMDVNTIGVLGILRLAAKKGLPIDKGGLFDKLTSSGFRIGRELYNKVFSDL